MEDCTVEVPWVGQFPRRCPLRGARDPVKIFLGKCWDQVIQKYRQTQLISKVVVPQRFAAQYTYGGSYPAEFHDVHCNALHFDSGAKLHMPAGSMGKRFSLVNIVQPPLLHVVPPCSALTPTHPLVHLATSLLGPRPRPVPPLILQILFTLGHVYSI